jgi:hypothetical protein
MQREAAMGVLDDLKKVIKEVEGDLDKIGDDLERDYDKAVARMQKGLDDVEKVMAKKFDDAEQKLINDRIAQIQKDHADLFTALSDASGCVAAADPVSVGNDVRTLCTPGAQGKGAAQDSLTSLMTSDAMKSKWKSLQSAHGASMSIGVTGGAQLYFGVGCSGGLGVSLGKDLGTRVLIDFAASGGFQFGVDGGLYVGCWLKTPADLRGGFLAVALQGVDLAGCGIVVSIGMPPGFDFYGITFIFAGGLDFSAAVAAGWTFDLKLHIPF